MSLYQSCWLDVEQCIFVTGREMYKLFKLCAVNSCEGIIGDFRTWSHVCQQHHADVNLSARCTKSGSPTLRWFSMEYGVDTAEYLRIADTRLALYMCGRTAGLHIDPTSGSRLTVQYGPCASTHAASPRG